MNHEEARRSCAPSEIDALGGAGNFDWNDVVSLRRSCAAAIGWLNAVKRIHSLDDIGAMSSETQVPPTIPQSEGYKSALQIYGHGEAGS